jgi:hypothetical protein
VEVTLYITERYYTGIWREGIVKQHARTHTKEEKSEQAHICVCVSVCMCIYIIMTTVFQFPF